MPHFQICRDQVRALIAEGAVDEAAQRAFLEIDAADPPPSARTGAVHFVGLAVRYATQGERAAALESFDAALDLLTEGDAADDLRPRLFQNVAAALRRLGDAAGAAQCLETSIELGATGPTVWHELGQARLLAGDAAGSREALRHAARLKATAALTADLALAELALNPSIKTARRELARLTASRPDRPPVRWEFALGQALERVGERQQARAAYRRALERADGELAPAERAAALTAARTAVRP